MCHMQTTKAELAADILSKLPRHDTNQANIHTYQHALQKAGFNYEEVAQFLADYPETASPILFVAWQRFANGHGTNA
jgi:hypothetical protein